MMTNQFSFSLRIIADSPEEESKLAEALAKRFVEVAKVPTVTVVANGKHINYIDGVPHDITNSMMGLFNNNPHDPTDSYLQAQ